LINHIKSLTAALLLSLFVFSYALADEKKTDTDFSPIDAARYFSGADLPEGSPLKPLTDTPDYTRFKKKMNAYWKYYDAKTVVPIHAWQQKWLKDENHSVCFYPFAGADFINAHNFFPNAKTYILIGLETAGGIPDILNISKADMEKALFKMIAGYDYLINWNYYTTKDMALDLEKSPVRGVFPHMLAQMGWLGLTPVALYSVDVDNDGKMAFTKIKNGEYCKCGAIEYIDADGVKKKVIFLHLDLSNPSLSKEPAWRKYLTGLGKTAGIMKAASYLPHMDNFSMIRDIALSEMEVIVQDDSSIPYKYFDSSWKITLFGLYHEPHHIFPGFLQKDLKEAYAKAPGNPIDFEYSYRRKDHARNLMLIIKK
jgi:hypothetical protein